MPSEFTPLDYIASLFNMPPEVQTLLSSASQAALTQQNKSVSEGKDLVFSCIDDRPNMVLEKIFPDANRAAHPGGFLPANLENYKGIEASVTLKAPTAKNVYIINHTDCKMVQAVQSESAKKTNGNTQETLQATKTVSDEAIESAIEHTGCHAEPDHIAHIALEKSLDNARNYRLNGVAPIPNPIGLQYNTQTKLLSVYNPATKLFITPALSEEGKPLPCDIISDKAVLERISTHNSKQLAKNSGKTIPHGHDNKADDRSVRLSWSDKARGTEFAVNISWKNQATKAESSSSLCVH